MSDENNHFERGPSGAHRWRRCKGSLNAERGRPDNARREAAEGTVFHHFAALALEFGLEPYDFPIGTVFSQDGYEIEYDDEMASSMFDGLQFIAENLEPNDHLFVEQRVNIEPWVGSSPDGEPGFGTADVTIVKVAKRKIISFDWKYGKGVPVSPVKNDQQYLYVLGAWNSFAEAYFKGVDPKDVEVLFVIEQPRADGGGGQWSTTMAEVLAEGDKIRQDALETMHPNAPRTPGPKQCQFCKASGDCREQAEYLLDMYGQKFEDIEENIICETGPAFPDPHKIPLEVRSYVLLHWSAFKRWRDTIHALTLHDLKAGREVPLLKAVEGRGGKRVYRPVYTEEAKRALVGKIGEDKALETRLISPAAAEKLTGKKWFKDNVAAYCEKPPSKPILVKLEDPRTPIQDFASRFDDMDDDDEYEADDD